ncbi:MAG: PQQ-dependent sugar dehydrogenase [Planctomycetales bacterium]|nr:PQQ-dependent sugar dehydrogenase [Planctomycetales bacterium]
MKQSLLLIIVALIFQAGAHAEDIDTSPIGVKTERAFPNLRPRRPVIITHAGDGSDRVFIVTQQGVIHWIPNDQNVEKTNTFLDIEDRVVYSDRKNEEGFLGLAFHPKYKENGYFYVYYTSTDEPLLSKVSRFSVSKSDPNKADPDSEVVLMKIKQPFWNHNGGTVVFGPDGYLYIALGDGGLANDPHMNGQNVETLLGSILRIDVDKTEGDKQYAIPADNPFKGQPRLGREEIFAWGFRNPWRMAFDRETGLFWVADVGQDIWEEINIVKLGGNYGWDLREGKHKFGLNGFDPNPQLIDPIHEYHHDVGKSITGGLVYRGNKVPKLKGHYLYGDYVSNKFWALKYDEAAGKVVANRPIESKNITVMTFGEDESGEVYCTDSFGLIHRFVETD